MSKASKRVSAASASQSDKGKTATAGKTAAGKTAPESAVPEKSSTEKSATENFTVANAVPEKSTSNKSGKAKKPFFPKKAMKQSLAYLSRYRGLILLTLFLALFSVAATLSVPLLVGDAIDLLVGKGAVDLPKVLRLLLQSVAVAAAGGLAQWLMSAVNNRITFDVVRDIRADAFRKIQRLPVSAIDAHPVGDTVSRVISDVDQFSDGLLMGFTQLFTGVLTILATLIFMFVIYPLIAAAVVLLTPISLFIANFIAKKTYRYFKEQTEVRGEQTDYMNEMVDGVKTVKAFSREESVTERFREINRRLEKSSLKAIFFSSLTNPTTRFVNGLVYAAVAGLGAAAAVGGAIGIGDLSVFLVYANQYTKPFNEISGVLTELQGALACAERIFDFLSSEDEAPDAPDAKVLSSVSGCVTAENVFFSYLPGQKLIENFSLDVKSGQRIAIVGPTGCGKTTVINLLMRFYDVKAGSIRVDGVDIREVTRHSLRASYGMVLQETWLKNATVRENLTLGRPEASEEEVRQAAVKCHCHGFISRLEKGYDTVISETGGSLSGGQKQLLCIARAMISDPPMLILDEATSSIDTRTERRVQSAMEELMKGRTSFIVAHRLSTVMNCDKILVMRDGNVVEQGTHASLMEKNGFYASIFNSQFAG